MNFAVVMNSSSIVTAMGYFIYSPADRLGLVVTQIS